MQTQPSEFTVKKWGNSLGFRITGEMAKAADISEGSMVSVSVKSNKSVVIKKIEGPLSRTRFTEKELLIGIGPEDASEIPELLDCETDF